MTATPDHSDRKLALIIANPATHGDIPAYLAAVRAAAPPDYDVEIRYTQPGDDALGQFLDLIDKADLLIAAGGDGTVATVANVAAKRDCPLAILPAGTANAVARDLGVPFEPGAAARLIFGPHDMWPIDIGRCNDRPFLHMGGAGLDSKIFLATDSGRKKKFGWMAYFGPAFREAFAPPSKFTLTTELGSFTAVSPLVLVALGGSIIWPQLKIAPDIARDDGFFDVFVCTATAPRRVIRTFSRFAAQRLEGSEDVVRIRCRELELRSSPPVPVEVDGDVVTSVPARFTIDPARLRVIVPNKAVAEPLARK